MRSTNIESQNEVGPTIQGKSMKFDPSDPQFCLKNQLLHLGKFQELDKGGTKKSEKQKNIPEMNVSELDLIPVKFL